MKKRQFKKRNQVVNECSIVLALFGASSYFDKKIKSQVKILKQLPIEMKLPQCHKYYRHVTSNKPSLCGLQ